MERKGITRLSRGKRDSSRASTPLFTPSITYTVFPKYSSTLVALSYLEKGELDLEIDPRDAR